MLTLVSAPQFLLSEEEFVQSAPTSCRRCGAPSVQGSKYCAAHISQPLRPTRPTREQDPIQRIYDTANWKRYRALILAHNPICCRIWKGEQCTRPSTMVHHIRSPRTAPELFTTPENTIALCANCHPGGQEGTEHWEVGKDFVATQFHIMEFFGG